MRIWTHETLSYSCWEVRYLPALLDVYQIEVSTVVKVRRSKRTTPPRAKSQWIKADKSVRSLQQLLFFIDHTYCFSKRGYPPDSASFIHQTFGAAVLRCPRLLSYTQALEYWSDSSRHHNLQHNQYVSMSGLSIVCTHNVNHQFGLSCFRPFGTIETLFE